MSPLAEPTISQSSLQNPQALVSLQQVPMGERDMGRNSGRTIGSLSPHVQSALSELGLPVEPQYANELRAKVRSLLNYQGEGFSGSQHVPFAPSHLQLLGREDYFVCEKACALRSLMIMICTPKGPAAFLLDSDDSVRYLQLHFPLPKDGTKFHHETLMDGEVIVELGQKPPLFRYMAFDLMAINGTSITSRPFTTRLGYLQSELIKPHKAWVQKHPEFKSPCMVDMKRQERSYGLNILLTELSKTRYQNEGLLFTPVRFPYEPGAGSGHILKWRAAECIFLDLKIKVLYDQERKPRYQLHVLGPANFTKFFDHFTASPETAEIFRSTPGGADGRIAEFNYDVNWMTLLWEQGYTPTPRKGGWRFVRFSTDDKTCPDDEETAAQKRSWVIDGVNGDTVRKYYACNDTELTMICMNF
ncbi:mRNA capping enzyme, catalytic domain-containing protein [Cladochytrium replicatum]|nr:mRNA capping enzyme, catalytic domain-containing protein [Cladochytrium replicatum]